MENTVTELTSVTYEQARILKKVGYPQRFLSSMAWYDENGNKHGSSINVPMEDKNNDECVAPSLELVAKWIREEKGIYVTPVLVHHNKPKDGWKHISWESIATDWEWKIYTAWKYYDIYEEALSNGIDAALEVLKENK
ncbi:MAG: hypothetical protein MJ221_04350 [Bacilli bacterium]|nr:hypothetical protein [Bacilli bacterium]